MIKVIERFQLADIDNIVCFSPQFINVWDDKYGSLTERDVWVYVTYSPQNGYLISRHPCSDKSNLSLYNWALVSTCPVEVKEAVTPVIWAHKMRNKELQDGDTSS